MAFFKFIYLKEDFLKFKEINYLLIFQENKFKLLRNAPYTTPKKLNSKYGKTFKTKSFIAKILKKNHRAFLSELTQFFKSLEHGFLLINQC